MQHHDDHSYPPVVISPTLIAGDFDEEDLRHAIRSVARIRRMDRAIDELYELACRPSPSRDSPRRF